MPFLDSATKLVKIVGWRMIAGQPVPEDNTNSLEQFKIIDQYEKEIFLSCCELLPLFSQNDFHLLRNQNYICTRNLEK